jgi:hypothetical protein
LEFNYSNPTPILALFCARTSLKGEAPSAVICDNQRFFVNLEKGFRGGKEIIFPACRQAGAAQKR